MITKPIRGGVNADLLAIAGDAQAERTLVNECTGASHRAAAKPDVLGALELALIDEHPADRAGARRV